MGPTPTRTLGMRLSCNFVNGYTIVYSTCLPMYTRASLADILARKSARVGQVGGQVGEDCRACPARGKLNGEVAGHADFRARILARMSATMSVSVSVPWNLSFNALRCHCMTRCDFVFYCTTDASCTTQNIIYR